MRGYQTIGLALALTCISTAAFASAENEYTLNSTTMSAPTVLNSAPATTMYAPATQAPAYAPTTISNTGSVDPCNDNDPNNDFGCLVYDTQPYNPAGQTVTDNYQPQTIYTQPSTTIDSSTTYYAPSTPTYQITN